MAGEKEELDLVHCEGFEGAVHRALGRVSATGFPGKVGSQGEVDDGFAALHVFRFFALLVYCETRI